MQLRNLRKHGTCQHADADGRSEFRVLLTFLQLVNVGHTDVVGQPLGHPGRDRCLHLDVQAASQFVDRQNVQNGQLARGVFLIPRRIQNSSRPDTRLTNQNGIQEVDRDGNVVFIAQQPLQGEIDERTDSDGHGHG